MRGKNVADPDDLRDEMKELAKIAIILGAILLIGYGQYCKWYKEQPQEQKPAVEKPAEKHAEQQDTIQPKLSPLSKKTEELRFDSKPENAPKGTKRVTFQGTGIPSQRTNA